MRKEELPYINRKFINSYVFIFKLNGVFYPIIADRCRHEVVFLKAAEYEKITGGIFTGRYTTVRRFNQEISMGRCPFRNGTIRV